MDSKWLPAPEHYLDADDCLFLIKFANTKSGKTVSDIIFKIYDIECSELEDTEDPIMLIRQQARCRLLSEIWAHLFNEPSYYLHDNSENRRNAEKDR